MIKSKEDLLEYIAADSKNYIKKKNSFSMASLNVMCFSNI